MLLPARGSVRAHYGNFSSFGNYRTGGRMLESLIPHPAIPSSGIPLIRQSHIL
jgi:hypothetical protein